MFFCLSPLNLSSGTKCRCMYIEGWIEGELALTNPPFYIHTEPKARKIRRGFLCFCLKTRRKILNVKQKVYSPKYTHTSSYPHISAGRDSVLPLKP